MPITGEFQVRSNDTLLSSGVITSSDGPILETDQHTKKGSVLDGKVGLYWFNWSKGSWYQIIEESPLRFNI